MQPTNQPSTHALNGHHAENLCENCVFHQCDQSHTQSNIIARLNHGDHHKIHMAEFTRTPIFNNSFDHVLCFNTNYTVHCVCVCDKNNETKNHSTTEKCTQHNHKWTKKPNTKQQTTANWERAMEHNERRRDWRWKKRNNNNNIHSTIAKKAHDLQK